MMADINDLELKSGRTGARWLFALLALAWCWGCSTERDENPADGAGDASPWGRQIEQVKQGSASQISVSDATVTDQDMALLADARDEVTTIIIDHANLTDAGIMRLAGMKQLRRLRIRDFEDGNVQVGDPGLAALAALPAIEEIYVACPNATDAAAAALAKAGQLKSLNLNQTRLTDAGLAEIARLEKLETLRLGSAKITDAGLAHVGKMPGLRHLILIDSPLTDAGLDYLRELPSLESLYIHGTQITEKGLSELAKAKPAWHIHYNDQHVGGEHHD